ncbi:MAG: hypothetical protein CMP20_10315 [Rickettsiales bacterium]|nr:hypothetical protein [Rickettsiales bacterium]
MHPSTFVIVVMVATAATALSPPLDPYGMVGQPLEKIGSPGPYSQVSTRDVSNAVSDETTVEFDPRRFNMLGVLFGQLIDHDVILSVAGGEGAGDSWPIEVATDDPTYSKVGMTQIGFDRLGRSSVNGITPHIDASSVYGSTQERLDLIRQPGTPYLRTDQHRLPPVSGQTSEHVEGSPHQNMFFCGDVRCSEHAFLVTMHAIWIREHNHQARRISLQSSTPDETFERARRIVMAEFQHVVYDEWLVALIGRERVNALKAVSQHEADGDKQVSVLFGTLFRFHSLVSNETAADLEQFGLKGLGSAFFKPGVVRKAKGNLAPFVRSIYTTIARKNDPMMVPDLRNFLFAGQPERGPIGHDLAALNGQRGRDQGVPGYNAAREALGLERKETFEDVVGGPGPLAEAFKSVYDSPDECDLWFCAVSEPLVSGSSLGETQTLFVAKEFKELYESDIHYWEHSDLLNDDDKAYVRNRGFSAILCDTTGVCDVSKDNAFLGTSSKSNDSTGSGALIAGLTAIGAVLLFAIAGRFAL